VQEFLSKRDALQLTGVQTHLIGHLQTNKVSQIVGQVDMIESVDSIRVAQAIHKESQKKNRITDILVEVNIGREPEKSGVMQEQLEDLLCQINAFSGIQVHGLMTVPPIFDTEREKRAVFSKMYKLFIDIKAKNIDNVTMDVLSMGMSSDYKEAIQEGATLVRIGSALFGKR
jgi:pyridoxal phosphate enzyme (YggS family)